MINELTLATNQDGLYLRQWASNELELIRHMSENKADSNLCLNLQERTKTLGVYWNPSSDAFTFLVDAIELDNTVTKRTMLSQIAKLYDPLGLLGPVILLAKILMQSLWLLNLAWDEPVPQHIYTNWASYCEQLPLLEQVSVARKLISDDYESLHIHGFCDASQKAFGACLYLRSTNVSG